MAKTVVGSFDSYDEAQRVASALMDQGFDKDEVSIVARDESGRTMQTSGTAGDTGHDTAKGAATGAVAGGVLGGAAALAAGFAGLTIPGIGPILAAGPIAAALSGAGVGAVAGGIIGALTHLGVDEEDADYYAENVRRGGALVLVNADDEGDAQRAATLMRQYGAIDIDRRAEEWKQQGWTGFDETAQPHTGQAYSGQTGEGRTIPVVQEELAIGKRQVEHGGVRVYSRITETPVEQDIELRDERAVVERRPVNRPASQQDIAMAASAEESIEIRETSEEPVVQKRARVIEEVDIGKEVDERTETVRDTVKRSDVYVDKEPGTSSTPPKKSP